MSDMTPRERVRAALSHQQPDRVPKTADFTPSSLEMVKSKIGEQEPEDYFGFEVRTVGFNPAQKSPDFSRYLPGDLPPGTTSNEWGLTEILGEYYHFTEYVYPMANLDLPGELDAWPFPDVTPAYRFEGVPARIASLQGEGYSVWGAVGHIFETAWYIRSMERLFHDWAFNPAFAERLLDEITDRRLYMATKYAEAGVDGISTGDDVGTQRGMMMSPDMWRRWLKPRWARVIAAAKEAKPDVMVFYHSDGDISSIIPELIEIGIDVLNPVQPECLDPARVKLEYGDRLAFWGTISIQRTMPFGTPDEVRQEVKHRVETVGKGGGLLLAPTHVLEPEVPWENIVALFEAIEEYGKYN